MRTTTLIAAASLLALSSIANASHYDGKTPLLCSIYQLFQCDHPNGCHRVSPDEVNGLSHFDIDFRKKVVTRAGVESEQLSPIESSDTIDNKLIIQGIEDGAEGARDGAGWTVSILDPEGTMTLAVASDGFGIMGLGACVPKP